jgi:glutamyl-tRNA reductase
MSLLVVGLSHRSAPVDVLDRAALATDNATDLAGKLLDDLMGAPAVDEAMVLATCNRVEVYSSVEKFHAGVAAVSELLARHIGVGLDELSGHLYVHYEDRAAQHLFAVTSSLDSMLIGEQQILGQVRGAFRVAQDRGDAGRVLHEAVEHALRAAKRAHAETGIGAAGTTMVEVGLRLVDGGVTGRRAVVVGAGAMASVAVGALRAAGVGELVVMSRTLATARNLAERSGGVARPMSDLAATLAAADIVVSCTGANATVITAAAVEAAMAGRGADAPLFLLDIAMPRDIEAGAASIPGVRLVDLELLKPVLDAATPADDVAEVQAIVAQELAAYVDARQAAGVAPTVVALRDKAAQVVNAELHRLERRLPDLDATAFAEIASAMRRVVEKLLHAPTVRVQQLAGGVGPESYPEALRRLFDLDQAGPAALVSPDVATVATQTPGPAGEVAP